MGLPIIVPILGALLAAGANVHASNKQDRYQKDVDAYNSMMEEKQRKEARRAALSRISLGRNSTPSSGYRSSLYKIQKPVAPDQTKSSIMSGIGSLIADWGSREYSNKG